MKKFISFLTALSMMFTALPAAPVYAAESAGESVVSGQAVLDGLMDTFRPRDRDYMYSPYSIKTALALAANGADDATRDEILKILGTDTLEEYNEKALALAKKYSGSTNVVLTSANSLWVNSDTAPNTKFKDSYVELVKKFFNATADTVTTANALEKVNGWCSENTNGKIEKIINDPTFAAAIANALYFKGDWASPFEEYFTRDGGFTDINGQNCGVSYMNAEDLYGFYEDENLKILELDYKGRDTAMYLVLDDSRRTDITPYLDKIKYESVAVQVPKFKIEYENSYEFPASFSRNANWERMFEGSTDLYLSELRHKTYINVDEYGTEAAAVTVLLWEGAVMSPKTFIADRPFEFYIVDKETKEILFAGEKLFGDQYFGAVDPTKTSESTTEPTTADPTTESTTEPTSYDPTTAPDPQPKWVESGIAIWSPCLDIYTGRYGQEYKAELRNAKGDLLDERTVKPNFTPAGESVDENGQKIISLGRLADYCAVDYSDILKQNGEGVYNFSVTFEDPNYQHRYLTAVSPNYYFSGESGKETVFSSDISDCIAVSGKNLIPDKYECRYRVSNPDLVEVTDNEEISEGYYEEFLTNVSYIGRAAWQQTIFIPKKAGIVTITLDRIDNADNKVFDTDERTYIIDADLKAHVYEPSKGYLVGDADNDGRLTAADSANVLQKALISTFETPVEAVDKENYLVSEGNTVYDRAAVLDINKNGSVDADDAARILQMTLTGAN